MRDLQIYANECINDMKNLGINVPVIDKFVVNKRAKSRFGRCIYDYKKKTYTIEICNDLLNEECNVLALKETIFHELIHTLPNCMNHGKEFKKYAGIINKKYHTNIKRACTNEEKYGVAYAKKVAERNNKNKKPKIKYELFCNNCGKIRASRETSRMPKWYAHTERYKCSVCNGKLEKVIGNAPILEIKGVK